MKNKREKFCLFSLFFGFYLPVFAESVSGVVVATVGGDEAPVPSVGITICSTDDARKCYATVSQGNGEFYFGNVSPGLYRFTGELLNGARFRTNLEVHPNGKNYFRINTPR
jgi:hypothetical protein